MTDFQLDLSIPEQKFLAELLSTELKQTRVEEHRTRKPSYREHVMQREEIIEGLLRKLGRGAEEPAHH